MNKIDFIDMVGLSEEEFDQAMEIPLKKTSARVLYFSDGGVKVGQVFVPADQIVESVIGGR